MRYLRELGGYGFASAVALLVDAGLLFCLTEYFQVEPVFAAALSFSAGAVVAYLLAVRFAFTEHRLHSQRAEFAIFVALGLVGLAVNACVIGFSIRFGIGLMTAKALAAAATFFCNFLLRRRVLFTNTRDSREPAHGTVE